MKQTTALKMKPLHPRQGARHKRLETVTPRFAAVPNETPPNLGRRLALLGALVLTVVSAILFHAQLLALLLVIVAVAVALNVLDALFKAVAFGTGAICSYDPGDYPFRGL